MKPKDMDEKKKALLRKIKNLVERGVGGEKESARRIYENLLAKYNVLESDLSDDVKEEHSFRFKGPYEKQLLVQILHKVVRGASVYGYTRGKCSKTTVCCECTKAEAIQVSFEFDFYKKLWADEQELFFESFLYKHNIFGPATENDSSERRFDEKKIRRMANMIMGMKDVYLRPGIEERKEREHDVL